MADNFAKNPKGKTKITVVARRFVKPDVVVEDGEWEDSGNSEPGPTKGLYTAVMVKTQGKWLVTSDRAMVPIAKK